MTKLSACLLILSLSACGKDEPEKPAKDAPPIGSLKPSEAPEPPAVTDVTPEPVAEASARSIIEQSVNATVEQTADLEKAPLYELDLTVDYELFTYAATARIHVTNLEGVPLSNLHFLLYPNAPELAQAGARNIAIGAVTVDSQEVTARVDGQQLTVPLAAPLKPGARVTTEIQFRGNLVRLPPGATDLKQLAFKQIVELVLGGDKHGGYGVFSYSDQIVSLALWYPVLSAHDEDGWDLKPGSGNGDVSYFDVANYQVDVTAPADVTVVATGVETERHQKEEQRRTRFVAGAVREFTIQMSRNYESKAAFVDGVKVTSWFLSTDRQSGLSVLEQGKEALKLYSREFGPYPYTELDLVEAPLVGGAGGVEFPGLVTVAKMFYVPDQVAPGDDVAEALRTNRFLADTREFVVAHEVAHQWWAAVVGSNSKKHPFVDEALANHSAILYFERIHGKKAADEQREMQLRLPYQIARLAGAKDRPVDLPADQYNGMLEYAAMVYGKGGLFFEALRAQTGDAGHLGYLRDYYKAHRFGIATPETLIGGLVSASTDPAAAQALADRWLKQTHGDEDVGPLRYRVIAGYFLGADNMTGLAAKILNMLDQKGPAELAKLVQNLIGSDGSVSRDIDYAELATWILGMLDIEGSDTLGSILGGVLKNPGMLGEGSMKDVVKRLAKEGLGGDKKAEVMVEAADLLLKLLDDEESD